MALSYNADDQVTAGLLCGEFSSPDLHAFLGCLKSTTSHIVMPMLAAIILVEFRSEVPNRQTHACKVMLSHIEHKTGIHRDNILGSVDSPHETQPNSIISVDMNQVTRDLTSVSSKLAQCNYTCQLHIMMLDFIDHVNEWTVTATASSTLRDSRGHSAAILLNRSASMRSWLKVISVRTKYLSQRAQSQVQTVRKSIAIPSRPR
jgi:hypothetical protein